jgi:hypothetical protein
MNTPKPDSDCHVPYLLSDAIGRTRSRSRSSNHATGGESMARTDSKTAQLRLISLGANPLSKPLEAAGRPSCERLLLASRSGFRRSFRRRGGVQGGQHQSGRAGWALLGLARRSVASRDQIWHENTVACGDCSLLYAIRHARGVLPCCALPSGENRSTLFWAMNNENFGRSAFLS